MAYTPGPWTAVAYPKLTEVQDTSGKAVVHWSGFDDSAVSIATHRANARLIAAAPELLEACTAATEYLNEHLAGYEDAGWDIVKRLEAATKGAEGGTP